MCTIVQGLSGLLNSAIIIYGYNASYRLVTLQIIQSFIHVITSCNSTERRSEIRNLSFSGNCWLRLQQKHREQVTTMMPNTTVQPPRAITSGSAFRVTPAAMNNTPPMNSQTPSRISTRNIKFPIVSLLFLSTQQKPHVNNVHGNAMKHVIGTVLTTAPANMSGFPGCIAIAKAHPAAVRMTKHTNEM